MMMILLYVVRDSKDVTLVPPWHPGMGVRLVVTAGHRMQSDMIPAVISHDGEQEWLSSSTHKHFAAVVHKRSSARSHPSILNTLRHKSIVVSYLLDLAFEGQDQFVFHSLRSSGSSHGTLPLVKPLLLLKEKEKETNNVLWPVLIVAVVCASVISICVYRNKRKF
jgi:hypothetical protein